ncbi:MAG: glutamate--cysteine ligase [Pseudomonadota bacterium]
MGDTLEKRLVALEDQGVTLIDDALTGLEKESLRVGADGLLADTPHPEALGSALANAYITTDFSEALLEFVTPAYASPAEVLECLADVHAFTARHLGEERLWNASMPCRLESGREIPLARYGHSNVAQMKTTYRRGLGHRYGREMQTIAGVHFNFSMPEAFWPAYQQLLGDTGDSDAFRSESYLALARNFRRIGWLALYLFGASPAVDRSFFGGRETTLSGWDETTLYEPHATSLRMSDLGYNSSAQSRLQISLDTLDRYIAGLTAAIMTPHEAYTRIGVRDKGKWLQLNDSLLQIENEYYSSIRPKQVARSGERPTLALARRGVAYVEVRALDVDPFSPVGIDLEQVRFMQALLVYCLLADSPSLDAAALDRHDANHVLVAHSGRKPGLELDDRGEARGLRDWADEILEGVEAVANVIDGDDGGYTKACRAQRVRLDDAAQTPSARLLDAMHSAGLGFHDYMMAQSRTQTDWLAERAIDASRLDALEREAHASLARQRELDKAPSPSFEAHLDAYFHAT